MKKILFILITIASLTACGSKKEKIEKPQEVAVEKAAVEKVVIAEDENIIEGKEDYEVENYDISNMADYNKDRLSHECYVEKAKYIGDPELEELYGDLLYYQEKADEWAKFPREIEELEVISKEIGNLKGKIHFRSLEVYSEVK